jgi:hypothetical protein
MMYQNQVFKNITWWFPIINQFLSMKIFSAHSFLIKVSLTKYNIKRCANTIVYNSLKKFVPSSTIRFSNLKSISEWERLIVSIWRKKNYQFGKFNFLVVKLEKVAVLRGKTAELPCDITPPTLDSLYLVLWYKNDSDFPIYK